MNHFRSLFAIITISAVLFGCADSLSTSKIYEIYTGPLMTDVEFLDEESNYSQSNFKTQEIKIYLKLFENGIANGVIETGGEVYSVSGDYSYMEKTKVTNETYVVLLESNRRSFSLTIDNDLKDVRSTSKSGVFQRLNATIEESSISIEEFNNMYEQGSNMVFFPLTFFGSYIQSTDVSDYWLNYFGYQNVVDERVKKKEKERIKLAAEEERRNRIEQNKQRQKELKSRICNALKNYDVNQFISYVPDIDLKYIELARKAGSGEAKVGGRPEIGYLPKSKYSIGYILDKGVVATVDGKPYVGPFTKTYQGRLFIGAFGIHGCFAELSLLPNQSTDKYIARCD